MSARLLPVPLKILLSELQAGLRPYTPILLAIDQSGHHPAQSSHSDTQMVSMFSLFPEVVGSNDWISKYATNICHQIVAEDRPLTVGRSESGCDIVVNHNSISKVHAEVHYSQVTKRVFIVDKSSKNGTFINGSRLRVGDRIGVENGSYVGFGSAMFAFASKGALRKIAGDNIKNIA